MPAVRAAAYGAASLVAVSASARPRSPWHVSRPLGAWQEAALGALLAHHGEAYLASATPAAGKTTLGLRVAHHFLASGRAHRVVIVAPTAHICRRWAADAASSHSLR